MKKNDITDAMKARLSTGGIGLSGIWPNVDPQGATTRPYFEVEFVASSRSGEALDGSVTREAGTMSVTVVVEEGGGESVANDIADDIVALFPQSLHIPITGGDIAIQQQAEIRIGVRDSPDWRVPVIIRYVAVNT